MGRGPRPTKSDYYGLFGPLRRPIGAYQPIFLVSQKTWILWKDFSRGQDRTPLYNPMSKLKRPIPSELLTVALADMSWGAPCLNGQGT